MRGQLSFDGIDGSPEPPNGVYFSLFPVVDAATLIAGRRRHLCREHGLKGRPIAADRLHVSMHHLGDYADRPPGIITAASEAGAAIAVVTPPFELVFDRVVSFENKSGRHPLVLLGSDGVAGLMAFREA